MKSISEYPWQLRQSITTSLILNIGRLGNFVGGKGPSLKHSWFLQGYSNNGVTVSVKQSSKLGGCWFVPFAQFKNMKFKGGAGVA